MQRDPFMEEDLGLTVNLLRSTIQRYFIVNDVRFDRDAFAFFIQLDPRTLEKDFDGLRREMLDLGFIPMLLKERPGYIIYVTRKAEREFRSRYVNVVLLVATIISTIFAGMLFEMSYDNLPFWSWETAAKGALYFAAPLMFILGVHEMGHFFLAKKHRVAASLPFFIPAPTILGTFGAFISLREPIHSRRALMDIGIAGPIAGFVVAIFVTILGFKLSAWDPHMVGDDASEFLILGTPLIYGALNYLVPTPDDVLIHPTAFAGWVGFLVTALNLLPAGQLDGGHIVRALFGDKARFVGFATIGGMIFFAIYFNYYGWIIFVFLILLTLQHPPPLNDISPLPLNRIMVGGVALFMIIVCFVPAPFTPAELQPGVDVEFEVPELNVALDGSVNNTLVIYNSGNTKLVGRIQLQNTTGWHVTFEDKVEFKKGVLKWSEWFHVPKDRSTNFTTTINITVSPDDSIILGKRKDFTVELEYEDPHGGRKVRTSHFRAIVGRVEPRKVPEDAKVAVGAVASFEVRFKNLVTNRSGGITRFDLDLDIPGNLTYTLTNASVGNLTADDINRTPPLPFVDVGNNDSVELLVWVHAPLETERARGLPVTVTVTLSGEPVAAQVIGFPLTVESITYLVTMTSQSLTWNFTKDELKNVTFDLISYSNVDVVVTISYDLNGSTTFEFAEPPKVELTLKPGKQVKLTVKVFAAGDLDDETLLTVSIEYGSNQGSSAWTTLRVTRTS